MMNWLTRSRRSIAGRLLALVYLFCVLAPAMSFAFADGARAAPCLIEDEHGIGIVHVHEHAADAASPHLHNDGHSHAHAKSIVASDDDRDAAGFRAASVPADHHKSSNGQCCGMVCVNALPAKLDELARPVAPRSICLAANYRALADDAPPRHYRPPIA